MFFLVGIQIDTHYVKFHDQCRREGGGSSIDVRIVLNKPTLDGTVGKIGSIQP